MRKLTGSILPVAALLLASCAPTGRKNSAQLAGHNPPAPPHQVSITILVLNGKTDKPVWGESPNIWIDDQPHINPRTGLAGKTRITVPVNAKEIMISPNWGYECRGPDNPQASTDIHYSISEILSNGVVTSNLCGKVTRKPKPGLLIFYERPSTFKERWNS